MDFWKRAKQSPANGPVGLPATPDPAGEFSGPPVSGLPVRIGQYEIRAELGRGGTGVVYRAYDPVLQRTVALKILQAGPCASERATLRFLREAKAIARLQHPHIVQVLESGEYEGHPYFTMPLLEGGNLEQAIAAGGLTREAGTGIMIAVASAVSHAHEAGLVHRDLKPANILLDQRQTPCITDFGSAGWAEEISSLSKSGDICGTPVYMAPEQALGERSGVDERADVYGLGATLYHVLTGVPPFPAGSWVAQLYQVINSEPVSPRTVDPSIPRALETVCLKAMAKERDRRYASVDDFRQDLERFRRGEAIQAHPPSWHARWWRRIRRQPAASLLALLLLILAGIWCGWMWREAGQTAGGWQEVFSVDFGQAGLMQDWEPQSGSWKLTGGELAGQGTGFVDLSLKRLFPGDLQVEVEARLRPGSGKQEIALYLDHPDIPRAGYYFGFGADYAIASIDRAEVEVALARTDPVEPGRLYRLAMIRQGNRFSLSSGGEELISYQDPFPLDPSLISRIRLGTYDGSVAIRRLRIFQERSPEVVRATAIGDRLVEDGQLALARREYERITRDHPGREIAGEALFKSGLCLLWQGDPAGAGRTFAEVSTTGAAERIRQLARLNIGVALRQQKKFKESFGWFSRLEGETSGREDRFQLAGELYRLSEAQWTNEDGAALAGTLRFITGHFPGTPWDDRAALILANHAQPEAERAACLKRFLADGGRMGKTGHSAYQLLAGSLLLQNKPEEALGVLDEMARHFHPVNRRFALDALLARGAILARAGRWREAEGLRQPLRDLFPGEALAERAVQDLEADLIQQRDGDRAARQFLEESLARDPAQPGLAPIHLILLYQRTGAPALARELLRRLSQSPRLDMARAALLFSGRLSPAGFFQDQRLPRRDRCHLLWLYHHSRGDYPAAIATGFHYESAPLFPDACDALRLVRESRDAAKR